MTRRVLITWSALLGAFFCFTTSTIRAQSADMLYDVTDYGAKRDGSTLATRPIQDAIDACYLNGGGTVLLPRGAYLSGTIILKPYVHLYLDSGATLHASRDIQDYRMPLQNTTRPVLIYANGATNASITGEGVIDGHSEHVYEDLREVDRFIGDITENARVSGVEMKRYYIVPPDIGLVWLSDCEDLLIQGVTLQNSSFWTLHIMRSKRVVIKGIQVYSSLEKGVNADGIDINSCQDVVISDCTIRTGDDGIALKTWFDQPCENIVVSNCTVSSSSTALKIGTESYSDFRRIIFRDCVVENSNRGLSIVMRDGGTVSDILFANIDIECRRRHFNWWGNGDPIWIYLTKRNDRSEIGRIENVVFENIIARGRGTSRIQSTEGMQMENIRFDGVKLYMEEEDYLDKRADHAFYAEFVHGLLVKDVEIIWDEEHEEEKWGSAFVGASLEDLSIDGFRGRQGRKRSLSPVIELIDVKHAQLKRCRPESGAATFLSVRGADSEHIVLDPLSDAGSVKGILSISEEVELRSTIRVKE